jgi:hypothetical protein
MQKVESSNLFSRFPEIPLLSGISSFRGRATFGSQSVGTPGSKGRTFTAVRPYAWS